MKDTAEPFKHYIVERGEDLEDIRNWTWDGRNRPAENN